MLKVAVLSEFAGRVDLLVEYSCTIRGVSGLNESNAGTLVLNLVHMYVYFYSWGFSPLLGIHF